MELVVKDEMFEKMVEIKRASDGVMAVLLVFDEDMLTFIYGYTP